MLDFSLLEGAPLITLLIGFVAVAGVSISKAGFGGALGSLSTPIMLLIVSPTVALGILLPLFIIIDLWVVWFWRHLGVRRIIIFMTVTGLLGQIIGWALLRMGTLNDAFLLLFIALLALYTGLKYFGSRFVATKSATAIRAVVKSYRKRIARRALLWCTLSGFSSFVSLTGGIPAQVYLLPLQLPRQLFVATMAWYLLFLNLAKIPFFNDLSFINASTLTLSALLMPAVPVGIIVGRWLNKSTNDSVFYLVTHTMLVLLGLQLLWRYFFGVI